MKEAFLNQFWGTFLGAFFAYVFGLTAYVVKKIWDRENKGYNALVKLELYFMECINVNSENLLFVKTISPNIDKVIVATQKNNSPIPMIFPRKLVNIPVEKEYSFQLCNLDMANEAYGFSIKIGRLNSDLEAANNFLHEINEQARTKSILPVEYIEALKIYKEHLNQIEKFSLDLVKEESIRLKGTVMFLLKDKPFLPSIITEVITNRIRIKDYSYEINKEIEKVKNDNEIATKKYQEQLDTVFKNPNTNPS